MTIHATGTFEVKLQPEAQDKVGDITMGRYSIDKVFQGDLEATSHVTMLAVGSDSNSSGAYVAIERVTGKPKGLDGSFVLMHSGTRTRDSQELMVTVVPGCSIGQIAGLEGKMAINIVDSRHFYDFDYSLAGDPKSP